MTRSAVLEGCSVEEVQAGGQGGSSTHSQVWGLGPWSDTDWYMRTRLAASTVPHSATVQKAIDSGFTLSETLTLHFLV